jgi:hypothetical protein
LSFRTSQYWKIRLTDAFQVTDDAATFNGLRANTPSLENFNFIFSPVAIRLNTRTNGVNVSIDRTLSDRASMTFTGSHNLLEYGTGQTVSGSLSNQQRIVGGVNYSRRTGPRDTWNAGYTFTYFDFANFQNSVTQAVSGGYGTRVRSDIALQLSVGVSQVQNRFSSQDYIGYNASANLQKTIQKNSLSLYYTQNSGESSGLGSISDTRRAGFSMARDGKTVTVFADVSAFETQARLDNTFSARGVAGTVSLGVPLTRTWSVAGGAQYQQYDHTSPYSFSQKRVFFSIRYSNLFKPR